MTRDEEFYNLCMAMVDDKCFITIAGIGKIGINGKPELVAKYREPCIKFGKELYNLVLANSPARKWLDSIGAE